MLGPGPNLQDELFRQQTMRSQASGGDDAVTPDSLTQSGVDQFIQNIGRMFGFIPNIQGQGVIKDTNVAAGFSPTSISLVKDTPGGVLARLMKYFTRDLPPGLNDATGGDAGGGDAGSGGALAGSGSGGFDGDFIMPGGGGSMPPMAEAFVESYTGDKFTVVAASRADLGELSPPATGGTAVQQQLGAGGMSA